MRKRQQSKMVTLCQFGTVLSIILFLSFLSWREIYGDDTTAATATTKISVSNGARPVSSSSRETKALSQSADTQDMEANPQEQEEIQMLRGDLQTIKVHSLTRVSVSNPEVADFSSVESDQVVILAKKAGQTEVFLWDEHGKRILLIRVFDEDLNSIRARLEMLLKIAHIEGVSFYVSAYEGKLIATGSLPKDKKAEFVKMIAPFTSVVRDLVKEEVVEDLVQIDVQIAEVNATFSKTLGLDWTNALTYTESPANFVANAQREIFKVGPLSRTTQIKTVLNALITEGKGRVLSKPKLVVISGKEASFQVGGQIPISTTTTSSGGNVQQNVEFKDYGIGLTITPTIKNNKVDVVMSVNVSDIDSSNGVGGNVAFTTRRAQTQLFLEDGQTVVLAGLIKHNEGESVSKIPFLGDIPIIGHVFRLRKTPTANADTELVITLTPTIIRQNPEKTKGPAGPAEAEKKPSMSSPDNVVAAYMKSVQEKILQSISYPFEAQEKKWSGTVKLSLHILKDGSLADVSVKESSGYALFDKDAVNTAQIAAPYAPFPENLKLEELIVTAPIVYGQKGSLKTKSSSDNGTDSLAEAPEPSTSAETAFAQAVQERIADAIEYPEEAREYGWEGTVKLSLLILNDGTLVSVFVKESSGHEIFDEAAVKTAKELSPYSGFPYEPDLPELNITVPIVFSLERE